MKIKMKNTHWLLVAVAIFYVGLLIAGYNAIPEKKANQISVNPIQSDAQAVEKNKKFIVHYKTEKEISIENSSYVITKRQIFVALLISFLMGCLATYLISVKALAYLYTKSLSECTQELHKQYMEALRKK